MRRGNLTREGGEHLVWGGALAVHEPVRDSLHTLTDRLKPDRDDDRRDDRQPQIRLTATANQCADADRDTDVDGGDEGGKDAVDQRSVDDDVDVVEMVFQDGNANRNWHAEHRK